MYLKPDRLVPIDEQIRSWAQEVVDKANAHTDLEKARAIYDHVVSTVKYDKSGHGWGRGDIYYACQARPATARIFMPSSSGIVEHSACRRVLLSDFLFL